MAFKYASSIVVACVGLVLAIALLGGNWAGTLLGGGIGLIGGLVGMVLVARALASELAGATNKVLGAIVTAMFLRMVLLAVGLIVAVKGFDWSPVYLLIAFFGTHVVAQGLEVAYVMNSTRSAAVVR